MVIVPNYNLGLKTNDLDYLFFDINQVVCRKGRRVKSRHLYYWLIAVWKVKYFTELSISSISPKRIKKYIKFVSIYSMEGVIYQENYIKKLTLKNIELKNANFDVHIERGKEKAEH